nr:reverse transcriptase domain-containing protein [Tanacetum cinerariifolium]
GVGSGTPIEPHHTPSQETHPSSHTHISSPSIPTVTYVSTVPILNVIPSETTPIRQYTRRARIAQSSALPPVADEHASPVRDVSQGEAYPTDSGFIADQDRATIAKYSTLPHDSAPRVTSHAAEEGKDKREVIGDRSRDDAPIKRRSIDEGEAATKRVSDDIEEMATMLTSIDAATVLASGVDDVARKLEEQLAREDHRRVEQIARDAEIARMHAEEELHSMIDGLDNNNETVAKYLEEYCQFSSELPMERRIELISDLVKYQDNYTKVKDFKGMTFEEVEAKFNSVCKKMEDFIPMGSKEEAEKKIMDQEAKENYYMAVIRNNLGWKRKGINLEQESAKKQKSSEEITEEPKSPEEVTEEKIKEMMQLVPIEEVYVESLQLNGSFMKMWSASTDLKRQRYFHACGEGLPPKEGSSTCDDLLQALIKAVNTKCETCGGPHYFTEYPAIGGYTQETAYVTTGSLPSNTIPNPQADLKAITTRSGFTLAGPSISPSSSSKGVDRESVTITDQVLTETTNNVPPLVVQPSPASTSFSTISSSKMPEVTKDTVQPSTENIQPSIAQTQVLIDEPVVAPKHKSTIPYPSRANKQKLREKDDMLALKFLEIFRNLHFELTTTPVNKNCWTVILKKLPEKLGDPDKFISPYDFPEFDKYLALADLGASINLIPLSIWKKLSSPEFTSTQMILELADRSTTRPAGIAEDIFVKVEKTGRALKDVYGKELTFREYVQEVLGFSNNYKSGNPILNLDPIIALSSPSLTPFEGGDFILKEIEACLTSESIPLGLDDTNLDLEGDIRLQEELLNKDPSSSPLPPKELNVEEIKITIVYTDHSALKYLLAKQDAKPILLWWILLLQEFDVIIRDKKRAENLAADHLSRLENPHQDELEKKEITETFPLETLVHRSPCFPYETIELSQADGPNFKVNGHRLKHYFRGDIPQLVVSDLQTSPWTNEFGLESG